MRASSHQGYRLATPPLLSFCRSSIPPSVSVHAVSSSLIGTLPPILRPYRPSLPRLSPSTPLKTAQNRPFCKRIFPPSSSRAADRAPEDLLKIHACRFSCKFRVHKSGSRTHRPAPAAYSVLSSSPRSPLSRSTSSAFLSASGTGTPSSPQFSTMDSPSLAM